MLAGQVGYVGFLLCETVIRMKHVEFTLQVIVIVVGPIDGSSCIAVLIGYPKGDIALVLAAVCKHRKIVERVGVKKQIDQGVRKGSGTVAHIHILDLLQYPVGIGGSSAYQVTAFPLLKRTFHHQSAGYGADSSPCRKFFQVACFGSHIKNRG